ncbi:MAG: hypothetical protein HFG62_04930 [Lachnospiraceae bacterium]|nr:hypothetical protein [Lachnospiraceae bacterium]MCI8958454.1 hypothetical protein [Lachnospiraceae bacterium]
MKKAIMCLIGAMMILSLAACTPTPEKGKTGEVKETQAAQKPQGTQGAAGNSVDSTKLPDPTAPDLDVISIYTVSADGTKLEGTMDAVEGKDAQTVADLLIKYGVLAEGTEVIEFKAEGEPASEEVGPGVVKIPGIEFESNVKEYGTVNLSQFPDEKNDMLLQAVANTFIENMDLVYLTIQVNGETVAENLTFVDAGK